MNLDGADANGDARVRVGGNVRPKSWGALHQWLRPADAADFTQDVERVLQAPRAPDRAALEAVRHRGGLAAAEVRRTSMNTDAAVSLCPGCRSGRLIGLNEDPGCRPMPEDSNVVLRVEVF